jgi:NADPH:quinone reductase
LIFINGMKGIKTEVNILKIMQKRLTISGSTLRSRSKADKRLIRDALLKNVWPKLISNDIRPVIDSVYPLNEAGEAHRRMESSAHIGKIVLSLQD